MGRGRNVMETNGSGKHEYSGGVLIVKIGSMLNGALVDIFVLSAV
jgi:hypothetical protein